MMNTYTKHIEFNWLEFELRWIEYAFISDVCDGNIVGI